MGDISEEGNQMKLSTLYSSLKDKVQHRKFLICPRGKRNYLTWFLLLSLLIMFCLQGSADPRHQLVCAWGRGGSWGKAYL